jgi:hypothetical protein
MYSKEVTGWIDECWAKGFTAEQTVEAIHKKHDIKLGTATVYRHRQGKTTRDLVDELMRQQQFDITTCDNPELKMKYRNELLKIFIPQMTINYNKNVNEQSNEIHHVIEFVDPDNPAETYPSSEVQAARRAGIIPQLTSKIQSP